jgi:hypothetical protein
MNGQLPPHRTQHTEYMILLQRLHIQRTRQISNPQPRYNLIHAQHLCLSLLRGIAVFCFWL